MTETRPKSEKNLEGKHFLVIEDHPVIRQTLKSLLKRYDDAAHAASGGEALQEIERRPPDLILLDVTLPDISGLELAKMIRRNKKSKSIRILAMSGSPVAKIKYLQAGCDDFILKPFDATDLLNRMSKLLRPHRPSS